MHERRVERVLIALPWMPCRRACALCPTACAPVCAPRSTNGPLLSRAGGCDKLRRCHRDDERIVLRLRVTVRVESARSAECALSVARQEMPKSQIRNLVVCKRGSTTGVSRLRTRLHLCPRVVGRRHHSRERGRGLDSNHYYVLFYAVLTPPGPRGRFRFSLGIDTHWAVWHAAGHLSMLVGSIALASGNVEDKFRLSLSIWPRNCWVETGAAFVLACFARTTRR